METKDKNQKSEISSDEPTQKRDWLKWAAQKDKERSTKDYKKIKKDAYEKLNGLYKELELAISDKEREKIKNKIITTKLHILYTKRNLKKTKRKEDELTSMLMPALAAAHSTTVGTEVIEENCKITNNSNVDVSQLENIVSRFYPYVKEKLNFNHDAEVNLVSDPENSKDPWGKTAYYDPETMKITIFVDGRHPKDMLRSLSHELVHHAQNCRGEFDKTQSLEPGYAQKDPHMRRMEGEAYLLGNGFLVRDFEDLLKCLKHQSLTESKKMKNLTKEQIETLVSRAVKIVKETISEDPRPIPDTTRAKTRPIEPADPISSTDANLLKSIGAQVVVPASQATPRTTPQVVDPTSQASAAGLGRALVNQDIEDFVRGANEPEAKLTPGHKFNIQKMKAISAAAKGEDPKAKKPKTKKRQTAADALQGLTGAGLKAFANRASSQTDGNLREEMPAWLADTRKFVNDQRWETAQGPLDFKDPDKLKAMVATTPAPKLPKQIAQLDEQPDNKDVKFDLAALITAHEAGRVRRPESEYDWTPQRPAAKSDDIEAAQLVAAEKAGFGDKFKKSNVKVNNSNYMPAMKKTGTQDEQKETNPMKALTNEQLKTVLENTIKRMLKEAKTPISETYEDMYPAKRDEGITEEKGNICDKLTAALETADSDVLKAKIGMKMADEGCPGAGLAVEENIIMDAEGMGPADDVEAMQLIDKELGVKHNNYHERAAALEAEIAKEEDKIVNGDEDADPKRLSRLEDLQNKHDDYVADAHMDLEESLTSKKNRLLFERLTKKWTK